LISICFFINIAFEVQTIERKLISIDFFSQYFFFWFKIKGKTVQRILISIEILT